MKEIWLLLSTGVLNVPDPHPDADMVQTRAFAYATREAALDALREFMRPDVNESRTDEEWDASGELVDDALDFVFDYLDGSDDLESDGDGLWTWDGTTRSYEWRLMRLEVRS